MAKDVNELIASRMSEEELLRSIIDMAHVYGYLVAHFRSAWTQKGYRTPVQGDAGFLDLVLLHPEKKRLIFVELKSMKGKCSEYQQFWIDGLQGIVEVYVWNPRHWISGEIEEIFK